MAGPRFDVSACVAADAQFSGVNSTAERVPYGMAFAFMVWRAPIVDSTRSIRQRRDLYVARRNPFAARWTTLRRPPAADAAGDQPQRGAVVTEQGFTSHDVAANAIGLSGRRATRDWR